MNWQLPSFLVLAAVVLGGFLWYEREKPPARILSLVAALAALAVVGRLAFAAIPNVKPTTDIVLFAGYALGAVPGFAVGAVTAIVSNVFLSQGPWTAWQMAAWGGVGVGGALLAKATRGRELGRWSLALVCGAAGLAFGAFMDVYQWSFAARQDLDTYIAVSGTSLPYNLAHAIGNVVFCLLIGPVFVRALRRYRRRFEVRWEMPPPGPAVAAALGALAVAAALTAPDAGAASASSRAASYLEGAQNRDGGFGARPGQGSSATFSGWAALGLAAARHNPRDVHRRGGRSIVSYLRRSAGGLREIGEVERTVLVLRAAGVSPRRFAGRDLVRDITRRRKADGAIAGFVSYTAFGVMALKAAAEPLGTSPSWLERAQNGDGGYGVGTGSASDSDMTGAVLQALAAAGRRSGGKVDRAVQFLRRNQNGDGGFGLSPGSSSNAQSTAYAVQGLTAVRAAGDVVSRAHAYLRRLQRPDGSVRYSATGAQTPVWVTAQALLALRGKPLPLAGVPRERRKRRASGAAAGAGAPARPKADRAPEPAREAKPPAPAASRALDRIGPPPASGSPRRARAERSSEGEGPSLWLVLGAVGAVLVALALLRRVLRRHPRWLRPFSAGR